MERRSFLRRALAVIGGLCGGASTIAAAPPRQTSPHVTLARVLPAGDKAFEPIDWFDQRPGDVVRARWARTGRFEFWRATGAPYWTTNEHGRVEAVPCEQLTAEQVQTEWNQYLLARQAVAADPRPGTSRLRFFAARPDGFREVEYLDIRAGDRVTEIESFEGGPTAVRQWTSPHTVRDVIAAARARYG